jgi:hypothetical protein
MTRGEFLGGCLVALLITCSPGLAGVVVTALTGPDRLDAPAPPISRGEAAPTEREASPWVPQRPRPQVASRSRAVVRHSAAGVGALPLILLRIRGCESGSGPHSPGDYRAENPTSTASGAFQVLDGTWDGFAGYRHAADAPRGVQDARALQLYRDRGTQPWNATRGCWA